LGRLPGAGAGIACCFNDQAFGTDSVLTEEPGAGYGG
jgi:hypothetical protein